MVFSDKLQLLRKKNGLSQEQLASKLTISRQAVSKWEVGDSMPDAENIVQISKLFEVSTDYLLLDEVDNDVDVPIVKKSVSKAKKELRNRSIKWISFPLLGVGVVGILVLYILSFTMISYKWITETGEAPTPVPYTDELQLYPQVEVRGDILAFVHYYEIENLFWGLCVSIIAGLAFLVFWVYLKRRDNM